MFLKTSLTSFLAASAATATFAQAEPNNDFWPAPVETLECGEFNDLLGTLIEEHGSGQMVGWIRDLKEDTFDYTYHHHPQWEKDQDGLLIQTKEAGASRILSDDAYHHGLSCIVAEPSTS